MSTFRRGFKSWCETTSAQFRVALGIGPAAALPAERLARHIGARVLAPGDIPGMDAQAVRQLVERDPGSWSAVTISAHGRHVVVVNPAHSASRLSNDIMHECSHLIFNHRPAKAMLSADGQLLMSAYDRQQEDEANWLAGALLLPRQALLALAGAGVAPDFGARQFGVSEQLFRMRMNVTGIKVQFARRSA